MVPIAAELAERLLALPEEAKRHCNSGDQLVVCTSGGATSATSR